MQGTSTLKNAGFRAAAVVLPFVVLLAAEVLLRSFGVAQHRRTAFVAVPGNPDFVVLNPEYVARYFADFVPSVPFTPLAKDKAPGSFRVIVLGGSSVAGFPYRFTNGFPARLQERLEAHALGQTVEVANLGMSAVNSYTLRDLAPAVIDLEPDAVVIYAGHNEYYGAFGVGSAVGQPGNSAFLKRAALYMKHSVLYLLLEDLLFPTSKSSNPQEDRTLMARVVRDATIEENGSVYSAGIRQFETNLGAVLRGFDRVDIPVYVGTLASNLAGQPPLGDNPESDSAFSAARRVYARGEVDSRERFLRAKELDNLRFRAPEAMNTVIRNLANRHGATVVETQARFVAQSARGVEDADLFTDHLHPNDAGYILISDAFFDALRTLPALNDNAVAYEPVPVDPVSDAFARITVSRLVGGYPFDKSISPSDANTKFRRYLDQRLASGWADSLGAIEFSGQVPTAQNLLNGITIARTNADTLHALQLYRTLLLWQPFNMALMQTAVGFSLASPKADREVAQLARFAANRSGDAYFYNALAVTLIRSGKAADAKKALDIAEQIDPDAPEMLYNSARAYLQLGDTVRSRSYFERFRLQTRDTVK